MIPSKNNRMNGYLQQLRKKSRVDNKSSEIIFHLVNILRNGWLIAGVALLVAAFGVVYALNVTPLYEANLLIQIKRSAPPAGELQVDSPAATEVEILRSRAILSRVVDTLQLDINVEPTRFPIVGKFIAARSQKISTPGLFGLGGYVWGSESARISTLTVPEAMPRYPFVLTATAGDAFTFAQAESGLLISAKVGERVKLRTRYGPVELLVARIDARPGARFSVSKSPDFQVVEQLQRSLVIAEKGKQSNIIAVSLRGSKPEMISRILNEIGREYIGQQASQKTVEAKNQLQFYDQQVAESKKRLQELDARSNKVLRRFGASDLSEEARILSQQSVAMEARLEEKEQKRTELLGRFAEQHPEVITAGRVIQDLRRDLNSLELRRKVIAAAQEEILSANRDRQVNSEMNIALVNARHKLDALMLSNNVNIRLVDRAEVPLQPVTLGLSVLIVISCFMGIVLGVIASIFKNAIAGRNKRSREVEGVRRFLLSAGIPNREDDDSWQKQSTE